MRKQGYVPPANPEYRARERASIRRPIEPGEVTHLERFGAALRMARRAADLTQTELGYGAGYGRSYVTRLETATRRPRRTGIERLAYVLVAHADRLGPVDRLTDDLCALAGAALAPESEYRHRVEVRREKRLEERERREKRTERIRQSVFREMRARDQLLREYDAKVKRLGRRPPGPAPKERRNTA